NCPWRRCWPRRFAASAMRSPSAPCTWTSNDFWVHPLVAARCGIYNWRDYMRISFTFGADVREMQGKGASRRLRHKGKVPAVLYGGQQAAQALILDQQ